MTTRETPGSPDAEDAWTPIDPFPSIGSTRAFLSERTEAPRLRIRYFRRDSDGSLIARVWFGPGAQGPPGCAHGGSVAAALDEAMGAAAWHAGHPVVAAHLRVDFRILVPLETEAIIETWVNGVEGRKVSTGSRLVDASGRLFAEAQGLFVILDVERVAELMKGSRGEP